jgi:hypothetical protein
VRELTNAEGSYKSLADVQGQQEVDHARTLYEQAISHPVVQDAVSILGGEIKEVTGV